MSDIPITLPDGKVLEGNHPIVLVGPNGSGKTTYGNSLSKTNNAEWIGATRNLQFSDSINMQTFQQATSGFNQQISNQRDNPWTLSNELNPLLAKLKAEDSDSAVKYRNNAIKNPGLVPENTKILDLSNIWNSIFPQREIDLSSYSPRVRASHRKRKTPFGISTMSGGERVALYLLARILDARSGIIVIDEPEIHFHRVLAKKFWDELERLRSDCRFVYITHDLPFAISRRDAQFIIVYSEEKQTVMEPGNSLPDDIIQAVLGAATFSVSASRIVFCEGARHNKRDDEFYTAWFDEDNTAVIPVGSCEDVIKCVEAFNENSAIQGVNAVGIIDRDFRSEDLLAGLHKNIHVLPVHEMESLLCIKGVFTAVGTKIGKTQVELNRLYDELVESFFKHFLDSETETKKVILERVKKRTEWQSKSLLNKVNNPAKSIEDIKNDYLNALDVNNWNFSPSDFFDEEKGKIEKVLKDKDITCLLKLFPGKVFFGQATKKLGIEQDVFVDIIVSEMNNPKSEIRKEIVLALGEHLPTQSIPAVEVDK